MPYVTQVAVGQRAQVNVFGNDYATPDGTGVRDFIHVQDLAAGHVAALRTLLERGSRRAVPFAFAPRGRCGAVLRRCVAGQAPTPTATGAESMQLYGLARGLLTDPLFWALLLLALSKLGSDPDSSTVRRLLGARVFTC